MSPDDLHGRARELERLDELARAKGAPVALWGPCGVGKSAIARCWARERAAKGHALVWLDLALACTRADLLVALARALDVSVGGESEAGLAQALVRAASARAALVVADDADRLDGEARALLGELAAAPDVSVVVTAREHASGSGDVPLEIGPLARDAARELLAARSGVALDAARAQPLLDRLDALPLALELAASRLALLGVDALVARLDEADRAHERGALAVLEADGGGEGHRSLAASLDRSWELLDARLRTALAACSLFAGRFSASLAEELLSGACDDALGALAQLRARALLRVSGDGAGGEPKLALGRVVRAYARARLSRAPEGAALVERHAALVTARAMSWVHEPLRASDPPPELLDLCDDLRALADDERRAPVVRARAALGWMVALADRVPLALVAARCSEALDALGAPVASDDHDDHDERAWLAARLALLLAAAHRGAGALGAARCALDRAGSFVAGARPSPDLQSAACDRLRELAAVCRAEGDGASALALLDEALALARAEADLGREALCLGGLGAAHQSLGALGRAKELHAEAIAVHQQRGARRAEGIERSFYAVATHRAGDLDAAVPLHEAALAVHREVAHLRLEGAEWLHLAFVHHERGQARAARAAFDEAQPRLAASGARALEALCESLRARLELDEDEPDAARLHLARARRVAPDGFPRVRATLLHVEGLLALSVGDHGAACAALEASLAASASTEVGFEALTPAYLALAAHRAGRDRDREALLADARARLARSEHRALLDALDVLEAAAHDRPCAERAGVERASSDVRRALRLAGARATLDVGAGASRVTLPDGRTVDLSRRRALRGVLLALVRARRATPGARVAPEALIEAGWPGERIAPAAALKRLHTAIWALRRFGMESLVKSDEEGYFLAPEVPVVARDL